MHVDLDNMDHAITIISGFEDLKLRNLGSNNAKYFQTVLKMNDTDLTKIAGQEGFGQAIKEGGKKVLEMIMNFLRGIKEFFFGSKSGKSDAAVSKVGVQITTSIKEIKAAKNPVLEDLLDQTKAQSKRLESILSGDFGSVRFTNYSELWDGMQDTIDASYRKLDLTGLSITNLGNAEGYDYEKLRDELGKLINLIRAHSDGRADDGSVVTLFKTIDDAQRMSANLTSVRAEAKKLIVVMSKDLEIAAEGLKRTEKFVGKDEDLTKQRERLETYSTQLTKAVANLVKLNKDCEKYLFSIAGVCVNMAAKVSDNGEAAAKALADFEQFMLDDDDLKV